MPLLPTDPTERKSYIMGLQIAGDFGIVIAVPVVVFVIIGQWIDRVYALGYKITIISFVLAALVSGTVIYRKSKYYAERYKELVTKRKTLNSNNNTPKP